MTETVRENHRAYQGEEERPLGSYARIMAVYGGAVAATALAARLTGKQPPASVAAMDLLLMGVCTHRLSRTLAKDPVTSPLRAPFTRYKGVSGPAELQEEPRGEGLRHAVGELLGCPFCIAQWAATGYAVGMVFAPRFTRLVGATMTAVAVSDWLQLAYTKLIKEVE
jgi:hypothetical protein